MASFEAEISLQASRLDLFDFLTKPENIKAISPPDMGLKFLDAPAQYTNLTEVQFEVQTLGQIQKITHRIIKFESPDLFVEELILGPLPLWVHAHHFTENESGITVVKDIIEFKSPGGLVGLLMSESRIMESLEDGFFYRHQQLQKQFSGSR